MNEERKCSVCEGKEREVEIVKQSEESITPWKMGYTPTFFWCDKCQKRICFSCVVKKGFFQMNHCPNCLEIVKPC